MCAMPPGLSMITNAFKSPKAALIGGLGGSMLDMFGERKKKNEPSKQRYGDGTTVGGAMSMNGR